MKNTGVHDLKTSETTLRILIEISKENTDSRNDFAKRMKISPRRLSAHKRKIEEVLNVKLAYCRKRKSYTITETNKHKLPPYLESI